MAQDTVAQEKEVKTVEKPEAGTVENTPATPKKAPQTELSQTKPAEEKTAEANKAANLDLMLGVPMQLSVEIGRTRKPLKEILEFGKESLVVLDKQAGDSVDLYVNGQHVAKGDVVVVDEHFGIRITEILSNAEMLDKI